MGQRQQRLLVVLTRSFDLGQIIGAQRPQGAITPARLIGDKDDPACIADQQRVAALAPFTFQFGKFQLDHHRAEKLVVVTEYRAGKEIAGNTAGHAHCVKTPGALGAGLAEVGTEAVIVANVTAGQAPVAGGHGQAGTIQQFKGRGLRGAVDLFQLHIQCRLLRSIDRSGQGRTQLRVQRQHGGQGAIAVDQGVQGVGVQPQLLIGAGGVFFQRLTLGVAHRERRGNDRAGNDQQGIQRQTQGTGSRQHAGSKVGRTGGHDSMPSPLACYLRSMGVMPPWVSSNRRLPCSLFLAIVR